MSSDSDPAHPRLTQNPHATREPREKNLELAIGRQVRELRKRARMTGSDLAQETGSFRWACCRRSRMG